MSKLSVQMRAYEEKIAKIGRKITFQIQKERLGFGHAVYQCRAFTQGEPVLLLLGDTIYESYDSRPCSAQLIDAYERTGLPIIAIHETPLEDVVHYGIMTGTWDDKKKTLLRLTEIVEKPTCDYAQDYLKVISKNNQEVYYSVFGQYILTPEVFEALEKNISEGKMSKGEYQLTDALEDVRNDIGMIGFVPKGKAFDVGNAQVYRKTVAEFGL